MKTPMRTTLIMVAAICSSIGSYQIYERNYLSPDLKRTLVAALDSTTTEGPRMTGNRTNSIHRWVTIRPEVCLASAEISVRGSNGLFLQCLPSFRQSSNRRRDC